MITAFVKLPFTGAVGDRAPRWHAAGEELLLSPLEFRRLAAHLETRAEHEARTAELARVTAEQEQRERQEREHIERGLAEIHARAEAKAAAARAEAAALCAEEERQRLAALVEVEFSTATFLHTPGISGSERVAAGDRRHVTPETFAHLAHRGFARAVERHEERMRALEEAERAAAIAELTAAAAHGDEGAARALEALEATS